MVLVLRVGVRGALNGAASLSLLLFDLYLWRLRPGVAIAGAAVVTGHAGEGVWAVAFCSVGVAGTFPVLGGTQAVDATDTAAAVCVGGGAGNAAAVGGWMGEQGWHCCCCCC
eukprot:1151823-Pelagomonas_calceolata.AAC.3